MGGVYQGVGGIMYVNEQEAALGPGYSVFINLPASVRMNTEPLVQGSILGGPWSGFRPRQCPIQTRTCYQIFFENYYILTECFYFNCQSFPVLCGSSLATQDTKRQLGSRMGSKSS